MQRKSPIFEVYYEGLLISVMLNFLMHFVTVRLWAFLSNWKKDKKRGPNYVSQGKNEVKGMDCLTKMSRKKAFVQFRVKRRD